MNRAARIIALILTAITLTAATAATTARPTKAISSTCPSPASTELVILTIGDSITAGATTTGSTSDGYRRELGRLLTEACVAHRIEIEAVGGTTCSYWTTRIAGLITTHHPDLVLLACGTNDSVSTTAALTAFETTYRGLLNAALTTDPDVLIYPTLVQYSAVPPAPSWLKTSEPKVNDSIYRTVVGHTEWHHRIPLMLDWQTIPEGYLDTAGVHPTNGGYDVMGRLVYNRLAPSLGAPTAPTPCGLVGRRYGGTVPAYRPCESMAE